IHGAMSITGLAATVTGAIPVYWITVIWGWVVVWFMIVETIECLRLVYRVRSYGVVKGFGEYHATQWSRIFTFGMLYAFTYAFVIPIDGIFTAIRTVILNIGPWAVLLLLVN